ncbi:MAG: aminotransferase class III-fold pyridoxal phosphate-dependent enzyme [Halobacteria archaeon]|nr:aminotransferase class III-fold pyridoxal phosphate-dependent enzyme [Halobacteria archaeon]
MERHRAEPQVDSFPGEKARRWVDYHQEYAAKSTYVYDFVWDVTADAIGPFCKDVDGNIFLDFTSHVSSNALGYNNPRIVEKLEKFGVTDPLKIAGQDVYASAGFPPDDPQFPGPAQLMERLVEVSSEYGMDKVFLSNSGAEAVENSIKICYDNTDGEYGFTFEGAFHGRTLGALSLNRSKSVYRRHFPEISGIHDLPFCRDSECTPETCECGFFVSDGSDAVMEEQTSELRRKTHPKRGHVDPDEVAYLVLEPVQGEGGYRVPSDAFMHEINEICDEHDILIIADEIQSGVGRTGEMWAVDHYDIEPDVIASAKALRVGATVSRVEVFPDEKGRISSTWGAGDLLSSLVGCLTIDIIREDDLLENAAERGKQMKEILRDASPDGVIDVRGLGLMLGVEFETREVRNEVTEAALERGLMTLECGNKTMRLLPPLDVTEREIEMGAELLIDAINSV